MDRSKINLLLVAIPLLLGGCGVKLEPAAILERMTEAMSQVNQVEVTGQLKLAGTSDTAVLNGLRELTADFSGKIDIADLDKLAYTLNLDLTGQGAEGNTQISTEVRGMPDYTYFRIKSASTPPNLPWSLTPDNRWYKVKNPDDSAGNVLGGGRRLTNAEGLQIRELIKNSHLFLVQTVLSPETVKGVRTHHLAVMLDRGAWGNWLDALAAITNDQLKPNREGALKLADNYTYDLWISQRDYHLVKLVARGNLSSAGQSELVLELNLSRFDSPVSVAVPSEVKEFTIESLLQSPLGNL
jgi:hypothetical protein